MDVIVKKSFISGKTSAPPSKSYTHRAIIAGSLSKKSRIINPLISDDTLATIRSCEKIGAEIIKKFNTLMICGTDHINPNYFNMQNSGTTLRIFLGLTSLCPYKSVLDGDRSLRSRPNLELAEALKSLGACIKGCENYRPPLWVKGVVKGGSVKISAMSSQFVTSLLMSLPLAIGDSELIVKSLKSKPYVDITLHVLSDSGIKIDRENNTYYIYGEQDYNLREFRVPSDFTSISYLISAGILAGEVIIEGAFDSMQGDKKIIEICKEMGAYVKWDKDNGVIYARKSDLEGIDVNAEEIPDLVPTIAVLAAVAKGKTRIYNAEHLRIKEIDRIEGIYKNLKSLGVEVKKTEDGLEIKGCKREFKGVVNSFGDHRMAMAFSLLGLIGEVKVRNAEVVSVSFPDFFEKLESIGASILRVL